jgi:beta-phosphoglucomutase-like phosphatase (HAD superfamily)
VTATRLRVLLCDADDNLFPSEAPAFAASCEVTNEFMRAIGSDRRFEPEELRRAAAGKNFRATAEGLAREFGVAVDPELLDRFAEEERRQVTAHLAAVLQPDPLVTESLTRLNRQFELAAVSSSATPRLAACFRATGLDALFPPALRFSAYDSLPAPSSKPDPAVYLLAGERLGVGPEQAVAIEDSLSGVQSAVAAGFPTIGNVAFVEEGERAARIETLRSAGARAVVRSWSELEDRLSVSALGAGEPDATCGEHARVPASR